MHKIGQIFIWNPITTGFIMYTLICVISMEFLSLSRRGSSSQNVPSGKSEEKRMFLQAKLLQAVQSFKLSHYKSVSDIKKKAS